MTLPDSVSPGQIIEFTGKDSQLHLGTILSLSGKGVRVQLLNGKETTIAEKHIVHQTSSTTAPIKDLDACRSAAREVDDRRTARMEEIDLEAVHSLVQEEIREYSISEIGELLVDKEDVDGWAAVVRCLARDSLYFRKKKDGFVPATLSEVEQAKDHIARQQAREEEDEALLKALKEAPGAPETPSLVVDHVPDLVKLAVHGSEAGLSKRLFSVIERAGLGLPRKLFQFLVDLGEFHPDEALLMRKYEVPTEFPKELDSAVEELRQQTTRHNSSQKDLRSLKTWALDAPGTKDRDDAFSLEELSSGGVRLWIHIADPGGFILPGSPLDIEARRRGSTLYFPDGNVPMLPPQLSEEVLSLEEGAARPAISLSFEVSASSEIRQFEICSSSITVDYATSYDEADKMVESSTETAADLKLGLSLATKLRHIRDDRGAVSLARQPELRVKFRDGVLTLDRRIEDSPCQEMVAEFMIWANHCTAVWCRDNNIPVLYRQQTAPDKAPAQTDKFEPVVFFQALRQMKKTVTGLEPGLHSSLGMDPYMQMTSPLRRYPDLLMHHQIRAVVLGNPPAYTAEELRQLLLLADEACRVADEVMHDRDLYYLLKYFKACEKSGPVFSRGVIVDTAPMEPVFYVEEIGAFRHCRRPSFDVAAGQEVRVKFRQIDPFERVLRYELHPVLAEP